MVPECPGGRLDPSCARNPRPRVLAGFVSLLLCAACVEDARLSLEVTEVAPPLTGEIQNPQLSPDGDGFILSWLRAYGETGERAFEFTRWQGGQWDSVRLVTRKDSMFTHPTELPSITRLASGDLAAVWQEWAFRSTSGDPWQYEVRVQFSSDDGFSWGPALVPHPGSVLGGEHEFTSTWAADDGTLGLVWIDPRRQRVTPRGDAGGGFDYTGAMMLMSATIGRNGLSGPELVVDSVVCECCPTTVAVTPSGPIAAYRDKRVPDSVAFGDLRYELDVVRDIALARLVTSADGVSGWMSGEPITDDGWVFNGCPNNGPALDARGERVALAWWTGEGGDPRVQAKLSTDGGRTFGPAVRVSEDFAAGQVSVGLLNGGAVVAWLEADTVFARAVDEQGRLGAKVALGASPGRPRLPRMIAVPPDGIVMGWNASGGLVELRLIRAASASR